MHKEEDLEVGSNSGITPNQKALIYTFIEQEPRVRKILVFHCISQNRNFKNLFSNTMFLIYVIFMDEKDCFAINHSSLCFPVTYIYNLSFFFLERLVSNYNLNCK